MFISQRLTELSMLALFIGIFLLQQLNATTIPAQRESHLDSTYSTQLYMSSYHNDITYSENHLVCASMSCCLPDDSIYFMLVQSA